MVGRVGSLHRHPVKSLAGEMLDTVELETRGVRGDRRWAVVDPDGKLGSGKSTRRFRRMDGLLALSASYDEDVPVVRFPDGTVLRGDDEQVHDALSAHVGRPVRLAAEGVVPHFDEGPVHLVTTSSLWALADLHGGEVDARRTRANLVVDTGPVAALVEAGWVGRRLSVGEAVLAVSGVMPRCVMLEAAQAGLDAEPGLLRTLGDLADVELGVVAEVLQVGRVRVGDEVRLVR